jgi:ABC-type transporter Mla subunit MlaD
MELNPDARGKLFRDATVRVRPFNGANFLELDVQPGHAAAGAMPDGGVIDAGRTSIPVATDQVLDVLDADTRAYVQLLSEQTAIALDGGGGELGHALQRLAPLSTSARQIGDTLATRRKLISALIGEMNSVFHTLGNRHIELASTLSALTRLLAVTGSRTREIEAATRDLPSVLTQIDTTGGAVTNAGPELEQALQRIAPAATAFASGLRATRGAIPSLQLLLSAGRSLADRTRTPSAELVSLTSRLGEGISSAIAGYEDLTTIMRGIVAHEDPIAHFSEAISGVLSTQDSYGVLGRVKIIGIEGPRAEDLGLPAADTRRASAGHSKLETMLASALRSMCLRSQPLACLIAAATPGLPTSVVPRGRAPLPLLSPTPPGTR